MSDGRRRRKAGGDGPFRLARFLPYQLAVLSQRIAREFAEEHASRHGLSGPDWRVMAILGEDPATALPGVEVARRSAMDPVMTHRAVERLVHAGLVTREQDQADRRRSSLRVTAAGQAIYAEMVPLARELERKMLSALSVEERTVLPQAIGKLLLAWSMEGSDGPSHGAEDAGTTSQGLPGRARRRGRPPGRRTLKV